MIISLPSDVRAALAEGALKAAAAKPWREVTVFDIAAAVGKTAADLAPATPGDAVDAVEARFDRAMAEGLSAVDAAATVRDRLFDLLMRRFEAMEPHRLAVRAMEEGERDPTALAAQHARHVRAARYVLALAGLEADGLSGAARAQGLAVILTQARAAWRQDGAGDFAKTMAALDKSLRRAEETFGRFGGFEGAPKPDADPGEAKPA